MSFADERASIEGRFNTAWGNTTPIAWDNASFTPPDTAWVRLAIRNGASITEAIGGAGAGDVLNQYLGRIWIQIFVPDNTGTGEARTLADTAAAIFNQVTFDNIRCMAPEVAIVGNTDVWYQVNVSIPYRRFGSN